MSDQLFERARLCVSQGIIQAMFPDSKSYIQDNEYFIRSPLRSDKSVGSFHINLETGQYIDHATGDGGTFIDLVSASHNITAKHAAEEIIKISGGIVDTHIQTKQVKSPARIPIPDEAMSKLIERVNGSWSIQKYGKKTSGWKWFDSDGNFIFTTIRHEKEQGKDVIPYIYTIDDKWRQGLPYSNNLPLYAIRKIPEYQTILVVEGEKCATCCELDNILITTWVGGSNKVRKTDWSPLQHKRVIIWADNDEPGYKAQREILSLLPHAQCVTIPHDKPEKWDLYDAVKEGIDIISFIKENLNREPTVTENTVSETSVTDINITDTTITEDVDFTHEFRFLGCSAEYHWFLPYGYFEPIKTKRGSITSSFLYELAPAQWWMQFFVGKTGIDLMTATNWLIRRSQREGKYRPDRLRGTGVWKDGNDLIINTGNELIRHSDGKRMAYNEYTSHCKAIYVIGRSRMDDLYGNVATVSEGEKLVELAIACRFVHTFDALTMIGWSVMAPFASALSWRSHAWLVGAGGSGKSYFMTNIIQPLVGEYGLFGSGRNTEAGTRRALGQDGRPVILDEMEPRTQEARNKLDALLDLARNASSDASASMVMAGQGSTDVVEFRVRGSFCFASIVPYLDGSGIESRFCVCRLRSFASNSREERKKIEECAEILKTGVMEDPAKYRRKLWARFPEFIENIKKMQNIIRDLNGNMREAEQLAPPLAAIYTISSDCPLEKNTAWKEELCSMLQSRDTKTEADEDRLIRELLETNVNIGVGDNLKVSELLYKLSENKESEQRRTIMDASLKRMGIRLFSKDDIMYLAVAHDHKDIKHALRETPYHARYGEVLRRHTATTHSELVNVRMDGAVKRSVILDWNTIKDLFF